MSNPRFLLDANIFIEAANKWYPMEIAPGFWDGLAAKHREGVVFTLEDVAREIKDDTISAWISEVNAGKTFVLSLDAESMQWYARVMQWVNDHPVYTRNNKGEFAKIADGFLIAYARAHGMTLVTQETLAPANSQKIKIPNVCEHFKVPCISLQQLIRKLGVRLVME